MKSNNAIFLNLLLVCLGLPSAEGAYVMSVAQNGPNVVISGSGTINTTALSNAGSSSGSGAVYSDAGIVAVGQLSTVYEWTSILGPSSIGAGSIVIADSDTGNVVALFAVRNAIYLPQSYVSGSATSGTATFNNTTIAALGLNPGTYTYTWGSGSSADSFILNIGGSAPATPAPSSLYLAAIAFAIVAVWQFIRLRKPAQE